MHDQLSRFKRVTLEQLWSEYCAASEPGRSYSYSQFCALYKQWCASQDVVLHHDHVAGEHLFIDYAGNTVTVYEPSGSWEAVRQEGAREGASPPCSCAAQEMGAGPISANLFAGPPSRIVMA